jgi:AraC-like DNA-binding protein
MTGGPRRLRPPTDADTAPVSYVLNLVELVGRWGITQKELLDGSPLAVADLEEPPESVPLTTLNALHARARELTCEPGLGFYLGLQKRISVYGFMGFAMMTAANLRECLDLAVKFTPVLTSSVSLRLDLERDVASLTVERHVDLGDVTDIATLSIVVGLGHIATDLTGRAIDAVVEFEMPKPSYYPRFSHVLPRATFGQPATRILFPLSALDLPLATSDRPAMLLARAECERALAALVDAAHMSGRVRRVLAAPGRLRSLQEVAAEVCLSPRKLTRRLAAEGLTFSDLVERERRDRALALVRKQSLSLDDVAEQLNYSSVPNFIRAFKRWTGTTPASYRRRARSGRVVGGA